MDKLVMTIAATANETRILLTQGPDEVLKARLRAVATPAHRFAGPMLCEAMALWHDQRVHAVVSAESEDILFALGLCDGLGVTHCTLHYVVHPLPENAPRRGRRLAGLGDFARAPPWPERGSMTIDASKEAEIRRLYFAEHWKMGTLATQLGIHHEVIERVLGVGKGARLRSAGPLTPAVVAVDMTPAPLRGYEAFVLETLTQYPRLRATRLHDMLVERGYEGSMRTVRRHVQQVRPTPKTEVFVRTESLVAEQAQIDWAHVGNLPVAGGTRQVWAFVMVLSYSRAMWAELVIDLTATSLRRSLVRACDYFGGATRQWLFDNPKIVVLERHGDAVRFHPELLALSGQLNVAARLCGVRKPNQKGKVERAIRYLRDRFFAARTIRDLERGNADLLTFLRDIANARPHPRWPTRRVADVFVQEQSHLLALPSPLPSTDLVQPVAVDKTAFARFDTNRYSVPPAHATTTLTLVASDTTVRFLDGSTEVAHHARSWGRGQFLEAHEHRAELLDQKRAARESKGQDRLSAAIPGFHILLERWVDAGRNVGFMTAKASRLLDLYGVEIFGAAAREAIARGIHDPGALAVLCEERRRAADSPVPLDIDLGAHVPDRDVIPHDLESYDAHGGYRRYAPCHRGTRVARSAAGADRPRDHRPPFAPANLRRARCHRAS